MYNRPNDIGRGLPVFMVGVSFWWRCTNSSRGMDLISDTVYFINWHTGLLCFRVPILRFSMDPSDAFTPYVQGGFAVSVAIARLCWWQWSESVGFVQIRYNKTRTVGIFRMTVECFVMVQHQSLIVSLYSRLRVLSRCLLNSIYLPKKILPLSTHLCPSGKITSVERDTHRINW